MKLRRRRRRRRHQQELWNLYRQGVLTRLEYNLCTLLSGRPEEPDWVDQAICWGFNITMEQLAACRASLWNKGMLDFSPSHESGVSVYRVIEPKRAVPHKISPPKPKPKLDWREFWVVFEQGARTHLMREGDLFPAERTLCGLPALNADWQPLPQFNTPPADYQVCNRCRLLRTPLQ